MSHAAEALETVMKRISTQHKQGETVRPPEALL